MNKKIIFIRDDDAYKVDGSFKNIFEFCLTQKIPIIYGIIPKKITLDLIKLLNKNKNKNPHLIDIVQHGWQHKNYNPDLTNKFEFGPTRNYQQQKRDIEKGLNTMLKYFNKNFTPAFVPPYHGYNQITLKIINELNFPIFSAENTNRIENKRFLDLPAQISLNKYTNEGKPQPVDFLTLTKDLIRYLNSESNFLGMVFHHRVLTNEIELKDMQKIFLFLKKLVQKKYIQIVLFSDILKQKEGQATRISRAVFSLPRNQNGLK
jgi:peptidoglycan/xylan/chitin deacetylase (PgdA/CDA1 family)